VIDAMRGTMGDASREVRSRFDRLEQAVARLPDSPERAPLAEGVHALREAMDRLEELDRDERHDLGHDLRVPLNAIAGWTHILRLDATSASAVHRAVDVFDRNVRALTRLIEIYTADGR
jgi:signal transduction histidine kinase